MIDRMVKIPSLAIAAARRLYSSLNGEK